MRKLLTSLLLTITTMTLLFTGCSASKTSSEKTEDTKGEVSQEAESQEADLLSGTYQAELVIKDHGTIVFEMDADQAPVTVTNFVTLAKAGFYDGLTFHRIIEGFMMQGGDPQGNGTGGSGNNILGEFQANGVKNDQSHTRGAVSMARAQDYNSASSQFFICHEDSEFLDQQYACFGYVTEGMEVVDEICQNTPVEDNNGTVKAENQPVIESITIVDPE